MISKISRIPVEMHTLPIKLPSPDKDRRKGASSSRIVRLPVAQTSKKPSVSAAVYEVFSRYISIGTVHRKHVISQNVSMIITLCYFLTVIIVNTDSMTAKIDTCIFPFIT